MTFQPRKSMGSRMRFYVAGPSRTSFWLEQLRRLLLRTRFFANLATVSRPLFDPIWFRDSLFTSLDHNILAEKRLTKRRLRIRRSIPTRLFLCGRGTCQGISLEGSEQPSGILLSV